MRRQTERKMLSNLFRHISFLTFAHSLTLYYNCTLFPTDPLHCVNEGPDDSHRCPTPGKKTPKAWSAPPAAKLKSACTGFSGEAAFAFNLETNFRLLALIKISVKQSRRNPATGAELTLTSSARK